MSILVSSLSKPVNLKINLKKCTSKSASEKAIIQTSTNNSQEDTRIPTSATSSKSIEIMDNIISPENISHIMTKTEISGAKEILTCFCCFWIFPSSFRGEEKNLHIDRCMEGFGDKDKQLWTKCRGDLKQYRYTFEDFLIDNIKKARTSRPKKSPANPDEILASKPEEEIPTIGNKKARKTSLLNHGFKIKAKKTRKPTHKSKIEVSEQADNPESEFIEILPTKQLKSEEAGKSAREIQIEKESKNYKVIAIPLVTKLVFDPSKDFHKFLSHNL